MTSKRCSASAPSVSLAVTVTVATPAATARMVSVSAETVTVATAESDEVAAKVSGSPSGSWKWADASTVAVSPVNSVCAGIVSATAGARFGTVTSKLCWAASRCGSRAVTVIVTTPLAAAVTVTELPDTETPTTPGFDVAAV